MLDVSWNDIGDDGIALVSGALKNNKLIIELGVGQCGFSVKGTIGSRM